MKVLFISLIIIFILLICCKEGFRLNLKLKQDETKNAHINFVLEKGPYYFDQKRQLKIKPKMKNGQVADTTKLTEFTFKDEDIDFTYVPNVEYNPYLRDYILYNIELFLDKYRPYIGSETLYNNIKKKWRGDVPKYANFKNYYKYFFNKFKDVNIDINYKANTVSEKNNNLSITQIQQTDKPGSDKSKNHIKIYNTNKIKYII